MPSWIVNVHTDGVLVGLERLGDVRHDLRVVRVGGVDVGQAVVHGVDDLVGVERRVQRRVDVLRRVTDERAEVDELAAGRGAAAALGALGLGACGLGGVPTVGLRGAVSSEGATLAAEVSSVAPVTLGASVVSASSSSPPHAAAISEMLAMAVRSCTLLRRLFT